MPRAQHLACRAAAPRGSCVLDGTAARSCDTPFAGAGRVAQPAPPAPPRRTVHWTLARIGRTVYIVGVGGETTRQKLLQATARLLQEKGYAGTGMNDILARSGAPRGSLYFHFPGGKAELAAEATRRAGEDLCVLMRGALEAGGDLDASIGAVTGYLEGQLSASDFKLGCPVAPLALDATEEPLRQVVEGALVDWQAILAARLVREGHAGARAEELATFALSAIEGALLLCKARRSTEPLRCAARELGRVLARVEGEG